MLGPAAFRCAVADPLEIHHSHTYYHTKYHHCWSNHLHACRGLQKLGGHWALPLGWGMSDPLEQCFSPPVTTTRSLRGQITAWISKLLQRYVQINYIEVNCHSPVRAMLQRKWQCWDFLALSKLCVPTNTLLLQSACCISS